MEKFSTATHTLVMDLISHFLTGLTSHAIQDTLFNLNLAKAVVKLVDTGNHQYQHAIQVCKIMFNNVEIQNFYLTIQCQQNENNKKKAFQSMPTAQ